MPDTNNGPKRGSDHLYDALVKAGIELLVGLPGTQTLPLDRTVAQRDEMRYVMARHETAIPHIAWGYYEAGGGIAATLTVPGPGDTNAMHGLKNALDDCVPIIHISPDSDPDHRGKGPIHEIEPSTYDTVVKENYNIERSIEFLEQVNAGINTACTPPFGPVRLGVPSSLLEGEFSTPNVTVESTTHQFDGDSDYRAAAERIADAENLVVHIGGGARRSKGSHPLIRQLVERLNAPVVSSYKGKGVFPEDDPHFLGVSGSHFPAGAHRVLEAADVVLSLGTNFDGVATDNWSLPFGETLVHVNLSIDDINTAYDADIAIIDDVTAAVRRLLCELDSVSRSSPGWDGAAIAARAREEYIDHLRNSGLLDDGSSINTPGVLRTLRDVLPRDAIVTTDVGGFRLWAKQVFEAYTADTYITAGSWAGMGVGLPAAIGAKLARPERPVISLIGDGGFMMCLQELHTAVEYGLDVVTVILNDSDYGVISKSPKIDKYTDGHRFQWSSPDFETIAEGFKCRSETVRSLSGVHDAVTDAISRDAGPEMIDVRVDPSEPTAAAASTYDSSLEL